MYCMKCRKQIEDDSVYCKYCGKKQVITNAPKPKKRANGTGSVYKLTGRRRKPWAVQIMAQTKDGHKKAIVYGTYATRTEALLILDQINTKGVPDMYKITVEQAYELWSKTHYTTVTEKGKGSYEMAWRFLAPIKDMKLNEIKTYHIQQIIDDATKDGKSYSTILKIKLLASKLCQWGEQNDVIDRDYASYVTISVTKPEKKERFSDEEIKALRERYNATKDIRIGIVIFLCYTGLRIDEFLSLKKTDYYDECLHGGSKTEKGKNRIIPVPDSVKEIFDRLMQTPGEYLYSTFNGEKYNTDNFRRRVYYKALRDMGYSEEKLKKRNPHVCRHTFASMCTKKGIDPKALQDVIGHKQIETTLNIYTHTDTEWLKSAFKDL